MALMSRSLLQLSVVVCLAVLCALISASSAKKISVENCEVCVKFTTKFMESLSKDVSTDQDAIEKEFRKQCKATKGDDNRFCYYVGGLEESATGMVASFTRPVSLKMPPEKVCQKLFAIDQQICDLAYEKTMDLSDVDLKKLKVKDLKKILSTWDETCKGCTEKQDYVELVETLLPKHDPEMAAKRAARKTEL